jgi:hypothetical protein
MQPQMDLKCWKFTAPNWHDSRPLVSTGPGHFACICPTHFYVCGEPTSLRCIATTLIVFKNCNRTFLMRLQQFPPPGFDMPSATCWPGPKCAKRWMVVFSTSAISRLANYFRSFAVFLCNQELFSPDHFYLPHPVYVRMPWISRVSIEIPSKQHYIITSFAEIDVMSTTSIVICYTDMAGFIII